MNSPKIEKERICMSNRTILWLVVSVAAAVFYLGFQKSGSYVRDFVRYEKAENRVKASRHLTDDQIDAVFKEVDVQKKQENILNWLVVAVFEALSLSLLLITRNRKKVFI